jgi:hypothetical protein
MVKWKWCIYTWPACLSKRFWIRGESVTGSLSVGGSLVYALLLEQLVFRFLFSFFFFLMKVQVSSNRTKAKKGIWK